MYVKSVIVCLLFFLVSLVCCVVFWGTSWTLSLPFYNREHYKDLSWVGAVDRKICPRIIVWHHEVCRMMPDCDPEGRFFSLSLTLMKDSFSCTLFISECRFHFDCWRPPYCDDNTVAFNDVIKFIDVNLHNGVRDVEYNQCISNTWEFLIFILPWTG